jgi:hypothetical protein
MWIVVNEADNRTQTEAGLVVHCAPKKWKNIISQKNSDGSRVEYAQ